MENTRYLRGTDRLSLAPGYDSALLSPILQAAAAIEAGDLSGAEASLSPLVEAAPSPSTAAERVTRIFARGLLGRISGDESGTGNLYLEEASPGAMLAAFDLLIGATPFIRFGYESANRAIVQALAGAPSLHVIDVGIGSGFQWHGLLESLATRGAPPSLRITGIDVPFSAEQPTTKIEEAGRFLRERASELGVPLVFEPIAAPVQEVDFASLDLPAAEALAINAAFALHHLPTEETDSTPSSRDAVLRRLRSLNPQVVTLVEPDVEHDALPLGPRVRESLAHYLTVFDALESLIPAGVEERAILENAFFGREILNIVVGEGTRRVERHERQERWHHRLRTQDFEPIDLEPLARGLEEDLGLQPPASLQADRGALLLAWKDMPLVASSAWRPARS